MSAAARRPGVLLLGWTGHSPKHLRKYGEAYESLGFRALEYSKHSWHLIGTSKAKEALYAREVLDIIRAERPLAVHAISNGGAWVLADALQLAIDEQREEEEERKDHRAAEEIIRVCHCFLEECRSREFNEGTVVKTSMSLQSVLTYVMGHLLRARAIFKKSLFAKATKLVWCCQLSSSQSTSVTSVVESISEVLNSTLVKDNAQEPMLIESVGLSLVRALGWEITKDVIGRVPVLESRLGLSFYRNSSK